MENTSKEVIHLYTLCFMLRGVEDVECRLDNEYMTEEEAEERNNSLKKEDVGWIWVKLPEFNKQTIKVSFSENFFSGIDDEDKDDLRAQIIDFISKMSWKDIEAKTKESFAMWHEYKDAIWLFDLQEVDIDNDTITVTNLWYAK